MPEQTKWESFTANDLFKDFNEVIDKAYKNTYEVSLINYKNYLDSFKGLVQELPEHLGTKQDFLNVIEEQEKTCKEYEDQRDKYKQLVAKLKDENNRKLKVNKYCLNQLTGEEQFNSSKSRLEEYFSSSEQAVQPEQEVELGRTTTAAAAAGVQPRQEVESDVTAAAESDNSTQQPASNVTAAAESDNSTQQPASN